MSTDGSRAAAILESSRTLWAVSVLIVCLFAVSNLPWQLDDYDQAQQAFTSFEMVKEGHWFFQRTAHEVVAQKPPLVGWVSAALFVLTRSWNVAWRLPSLVTALVLAAILFRTAIATYGRLPALLALSAFSLNLLSLRLATLVRTDMPLALVIFLPGLLVWQRIRAGGSWERRERWAMFALLTASMFIKGPIAFAFLFPGMILFQLLAAKRTRTNAWCGWWVWIASLALFLIWPICGIEFIPNFYQKVAVKEFLGRFSETVHRPQPVLFYLPHLLHKFAPWSLLMIGMAIDQLHAMKCSWRQAFRRIAPETFWLICWSVGGFAVMSLIPSKRVDRIFPVIPPLCLLLAAQIGYAMGDRERRQRVYIWSATALAVSVLCMSVYSSWKVVSAYRDHQDALVLFGRDVRHEAEKHKWNYEVVWTPDEGLLLYLERMHYIKRAPAIESWNSGKVDALVVSSKQAPDLMRDLNDATVSSLKSRPRRNGKIDYVLITR